MNNIIQQLLESGFTVGFGAKIDWQNPETNQFSIYVSNSGGAIFSRQASSVEELEHKTNRALVAAGAQSWGKINTTVDPETGDVIHQVP